MIGSTANIQGLVADAVPRVLNRTALPVIANSNGLLHMLMGKRTEPYALPKDVPDSMPYSPGFANLNVGFSGTQFESRMLMAVDEPNYVGYLDPLDAYSDVTLSYQEKRANAKGNFARVVLPYTCDPAKLDLIDGDEAKCNSFISEEAVAVAHGFERFLGRAVHAYADQKDNSIGGWQLPLNGASGTYLGIDMSDPDNVDFTAGQLNLANAAMNFKHIGQAVNKSRAKGGMPNLAICNEANMNGIELVVEGKYTLQDNDDTWRKFGGTYIYVKGVRFLLDSYAPTGEKQGSTAGTTMIPYIDTRFVQCFMRSTGFKMSELQRHPNKNAVLLAFVDMYFALVFQNPKTCVLAYNINGFA